MEAMNKFAAMSKLMAGEVTGITSPDGKSKYSLVDGSIVTPRKKALDMKDMSEDGWTCKAVLNWYDHIGDGIFCIDEETQNTASFPLLIVSMDDDGTGIDVNGTEWQNLRPATQDELIQYIWNADEVEKQLAKEEKKKSSSKKVKEEKPEKENEVEQPEVEQPKAEAVEAPEIKEQEAEDTDATVVPDNLNEDGTEPESEVTEGNDSSHSQSKKPTVKPKEESGEFVIESGVAQRKRYFQSLGLPTEMWEDFVKHYSLTNDNIEEFASRQVSDVLKDIQDFVSA